MSIWYDEDDEDRGPYRSARKAGKPMGAGAPHYPNKNERKELARIMQSSGLTEEQVRENVDHRRRLAEAAKAGMRTTNEQQKHRLLFEAKRLRRDKAFYMNLPTWHPDVLVACLKDCERSWGRSRHDLAFVLKTLARHDKQSSS